MELHQYQALLADFDAAIYSDCREAGKKHRTDVNVDVLRAQLVTAIENGQAMSRAFVEHRRAWRASLGLPALC